jgi:hypothetical protein
MAETRHQSFKRAILVAFVGHLVLSVWCIERGLLNADEGWYLYAARQIAHGLDPHRDFALFQVSVFPRILAGLVDFGPGALIAGRWLSGAMLVMATGLSVLAAVRLTGLAGGAIVAVTMGLHPLVVSTGVLVKPYGLAMLLMAGGLFLMSGRDRFRVALGFLLFGLAAGTRLSLAVTVFPLLWGQRDRHIRAATVGVLVGLGLAFWPVLSVDPAVLWHDLVGFHLGEGGSIRGRTAWLIWQCLVGLVMLGCLWPGGSSPRLSGLRWAAGLGVAVHLIPAASQVEHTVVVAPLLSLALADRWADRLAIKPLIAGVVLFVFSSIVSSRFVHLDAGASTVQQTTNLGRWIREHTPANRPLLTQQLALAVEADRDVCAGFEMGRFGWSPTRSPDQVIALNLLGPERLNDHLERPLGGIVLAAGDLDARHRRRVSDVARLRFGQHRQVSHYGQFSETLDLWVSDGGLLWAE